MAPGVRDPSVLLFSPDGDRLCAMGKAFAVLSDRQFRRYFTGQTLSTFGDSLVPLTIAFAALQVGGPHALGLVLAANRVPIALLVLFGGALGDRWDRRWVMITADVLRCATQAVAGALLVTGGAGLWSLVVLQALAGVGMAMFTPAATGLIGALVPVANLQRANALLGLTANTNKVVSISIAGILVATVGPGVSLLVDAATFAASTVSLLLLRIPAAVRTTGRRSMWREVRDGAQVVAATPWLRTLLVYSALLQALVIGPHMVAGPLLATEMFGGAGAWATIGAVQAVGSIAGGVIALRYQPMRPLACGITLSLLMVPYLALFAVGAPLWLVAGTAVAVGVQGPLFLAIQATAIQQHVPEGALSRVSAWSQLGNLVLLPLSLSGAGPIAAHLGGQAVLLAGAGWLAVSTLAVLAVPAVRGFGHKKASPTETVSRHSGERCV
jgi:MFS family permease